jgi:hypothetical protein
MVVMRALKTEIQKDYCSVESLALRKVQMMVIPKDYYSVVMTDQMRAVMKACYSVVKKAQLIK